MKKLLFLLMLVSSSFSFSQELTVKDKGVSSAKVEKQKACLMPAASQSKIASSVVGGLLCCFCVGGSLGYCAKEGCPVAFCAALAFLQDNNGSRDKEKYDVATMNR